MPRSCTSWTGVFLWAAGWLLGSLAGCAPDLHGPTVEIEQVQGLSLIRLKGSVESTNEDGVYSHILVSLYGDTMVGELEGYIGYPSGDSYLLQTTLVPEVLQYDYERVYMVLASEDCVIELDAVYQAPDQRENMSDLYYLNGTMYVQYGLMEQTWAVQTTQNDVVWLIEFPDGTVEATRP